MAQPPVRANLSCFEYLLVASKMYSSKVAVARDAPRAAPAPLSFSNSSWISSIVFAVSIFLLNSQFLLRKSFAIETKIFVRCFNPSPILWLFCRPSKILSKWALPFSVLSQHWPGKWTKIHLEKFWRVWPFMVYFWEKVCIFVRSCYQRRACQMFILYKADLTCAFLMDKNIWFEKWHIHKLKEVIDYRIFCRWFATIDMRIRFEGRSGWRLRDWLSTPGRFLTNITTLLSHNIFPFYLSGSKSFIYSWPINATVPNAFCFACNNFSSLSSSSHDGSISTALNPFSNSLLPVYLNSEAKDLKKVTWHWFTNAVLNVISESYAMSVKLRSASWQQRSAYRGPKCFSCTVFANSSDTIFDKSDLVLIWAQTKKKRRLNFSSPEIVYCRNFRMRLLSSCVFLSELFLWIWRQPVVALASTK